MRDARCRVPHFFAAASPEGGARAPEPGEIRAAAGVSICFDGIAEASILLHRRWFRACCSSFSACHPGSFRAGYPSACAAARCTRWAGVAIPLAAKLRPLRPAGSGLVAVRRLTVHGPTPAATAVSPCWKIPCGSKACSRTRERASGSRISKRFRLLSRPSWRAMRSRAKRSGGCPLIARRSPGDSGPRRRPSGYRHPSAHPVAKRGARALPCKEPWRSVL